MNEDSHAGKCPMPPNPLDELSIQAPGRLLTIEVLLALMARDHPRKNEIFCEAGVMLARIEQQLRSELDVAADQKLENMFVVSRAWLAKLEAEATI